KPSPLLAPLTIPAISVNSNAVGIVFLGFTNSVNLFKRLSGTSTIPTLGSMVANGELAASTLACVMALNNVDVPTFGSPRIPAAKDMHLSPLNDVTTLDHR